MKPIALVLVLAAACGSVKGQATPDAPPVDANTVDADLSGMLSVVTQTHAAGGAGVGSAQGMVDIVSLAPDGTLEDMVQTDATGHATLKAYPGGTVTAIYRHTLDMGADLATFVGVKPGDNLTFGSYWTAPFDGTFLGAMTLSWPAMAGASTYGMFWPCGGVSGTTATSWPNVNEYKYCKHDPMGVVTVASNAAGTPVGFGYSLVNFQSGGSAGLASWQPAATGTANISGLPPEVTSVFFQLAATSGGFQIYNQGVSQQPTGGAATLTFPWASIGDRVISTVQVARAGQYAGIQIMDSLNPSTTSTTVASPQLPPWVAGRFGSAAARMGAWFPVGAATHDGDVALVNWSHNAMGTNEPFSWTFILPPDATTLSFPKLPSQFDDTQPHPEDGSGFQIHLLELPTANGYDDFRKVPEAVLACPQCALEAGAVQRVIESD